MTRLLLGVLALWVGLEVVGNADSIDSQPVAPMPLMEVGVGLPAD